MKKVFYVLVTPVLSLFFLISPSVPQVQATSLDAQLIVKAINGAADYSVGEKWTPLKTDTALTKGTVLRTTADSTVDLLFPDSGTVLRLVPDSSLRIERLGKMTTEIETVTDTQLVLLKGSVVGSQRKLTAASRFSIVTEKGDAVIRGTEYVVRADGAVSVLNGAVSINYNLPGGKGSVKVVIPAGYSFNPASGQVVPTTPVYLQNLIAHIDTVKNNAQVFKAGNATLVVRPEQFVTPISPKGNNGVGNGIDPQPPGNPPINDGPGTGPGNPGNRGGFK